MHPQRLAVWLRLRQRTILHISRTVSFVDLLPQLKRSCRLCVLSPPRVIWLHTTRLPVRVDPAEQYERWNGTQLNCASRTAGESFSSQANGSTSHIFFAYASMCASLVPIIYTEATIALSGKARGKRCLSFFASCARFRRLSFLGSHHSKRKDGRDEIRKGKTTHGLLRFSWSDRHTSASPSLSCN